MNMPIDFHPENSLLTEALAIEHMAEAMKTRLDQIANMGSFAHLSIKTLNQLMNLAITNGDPIDTAFFAALIAEKGGKTMPPLRLMPAAQNEPESLYDRLAAAESELAAVKNARPILVAA